MERCRTMRNSDSEMSRKRGIGRGDDGRGLGWMLQYLLMEKIKEEQCKKVEQWRIVTLKEGLGKEGDEDQMMEEDWDGSLATFWWKNERRAMETSRTMRNSDSETSRKRGIGRGDDGRGLGWMLPSGWRIFGRIKPLGNFPLTHIGVKVKGRGGGDLLPVTQATLWPRIEARGWTDCV